MNPAQQKAGPVTIHFRKIWKANLVEGLGQGNISVTAGLFGGIRAVIECGSLVTSKKNAWKKNPSGYNSDKNYLGDNDVWTTNLVRKSFVLPVWFLAESSRWHTSRCLGIQSWFCSDFLKITKTTDPETMQPEPLTDHERGNKPPLAKNSISCLLRIP